MESIWLKDSKKEIFPSLNGEISTDIVIVGGGIGGISLAYELVQSGKKVVLVDQNRFYHATTGLTTGKITFQHGYKYQYLFNYGKDYALNYYLGNCFAMKRINKIITDLKIDCDYHSVDHYLFDREQTPQLKKEKSAYSELNIPFEEIKKENYYALKVDNQGVFHVVKYLDGILNYLKKFNNIELYENSKVIDVEYHDDAIIAFGENFSIKTKKIVFASFYPNYKKFNFYFTRLKPVLSFVNSAPCVNIEFSSGIKESDPVFSYRSVDKKTMLFAGFSEDNSKFPSFDLINELKKEADTLFGCKKSSISWVNQDYDTMDNLPLIGKIKENAYIMTGYNKWGITTSVLAANIIKEMILFNSSNYEKYFTPLRMKRIDQRLLYLLNNPLTFISSHLKRSPKKCTHLYCGLRYNPISETYDCPCHGSRFDKNGKVIIGPARKDLK